MRRHCFPAVCWVFIPWLLGALHAEPVDFLRDVRPILAKHCFKCHGPDDNARKAKLRLDVREGALAKSKSGQPAIIPAKPDESELVKRIVALDETEVMPPPSTKNPLSDAQKQILKRWIAEGAEYKPHWAFVAPKRPSLPTIKQTDWPLNPIDYFILARLEKEGLQPSPPADKYTLVRRMYLDLLGLPPTPEEADAFVKDESPAAYEKLVDRLLASPHYGERWARRWLDLARYADTNGYEKDRTRSIWPYRDWVINALNADMPFDQFTIDQIAGDLLPNAILDQRIATGFHRNTMLNEEGGIDPLEFRFHAMTDRVGTTATAWLGLTLGCAQCHTHKYDPIPHREYYQFMAFLNNADEPEMDIPRTDLLARRSEIEKQIAALNADLPNRFPVEGEWRWSVAKPASAVTASGAKVENLEDGSIRLSGNNREHDSYTITIDSDLADVAALKLEALTDPALGNKGPGRTPHGNFVLTEVAVTAGPKNSSDKNQAVKISRGEADAAQDEFPVSNAFDGNQKTGWAIHVAGNWNVNRTATFTLEKPVSFPGGTRWTIRLDQNFGGQHTLGKFRLSLGQQVKQKGSIEVRRREHLERKFNDWLKDETARAVPWTILKPVEAKSTPALLTILNDSSVLASGDMTKRDIYALKIRTDLDKITAIRLEVLQDKSLPKHGPGRIYYEGPFGDFFLSEVTVTAHGQPVKLAKATHSFASGASGAPAAIDGDPLTGWSINGGQGQAHTAVFNFATPVDAKELHVQLLFERYYAAGLGRFRLAATASPRSPEARGLPTEIEEMLLGPADRRTPEQRDKLLRHYLSIAPELAPERETIKKLREGMPALPTTLVFAERPANNPRSTHIHKRGEFLQPLEKVEPKGLSILHRLPVPPGADAPGSPNRLDFARWLVDVNNPLVGRVTMNRHWAAFFGRGIVRTTEDFGFQGELPSHPDLLDWLAVEFTQGPASRGREPPEDSSWSVKKMHRLIVTSATYRQSSRVTPDLLAQDPQNKLLARGPRFRIEGELVRDSALRMSGLFSPKIGGPSVFPPQPASVTTEGAYGGLVWNTSAGADRYRRALYTFSKRTAPYAMFITFDAPSGEACIARRELSNTPLQALTLLNDAVFLDASQALGRMLASRPGSLRERIAYLFRSCLSRPPNTEELQLLERFYQDQKRRLTAKELDALAIGGPGEGDPLERAAWTAIARALLNLDETITKN